MSAVWLGLVLATALSTAIGADHGTGSKVAVVLLALASMKGRFVGLYFMELRDAPIALRGAFEAYCLASWLLLAGLYLWA